MQFQGISFRLGVVVVPEPQVDVFRNVCAVVWAFAFVSECDCLSPDCRGADVCGSVSRPTCSELKENESATPGRAVPGRAFASMRYISSRRRKVFAEDIEVCGVLLPFWPALKRLSGEGFDYFVSCALSNVSYYLQGMGACSYVYTYIHMHVSPAIRIFSSSLCSSPLRFISRLCMGPL